MGMAGEEHVGEQNSVWFTKSHFPSFGKVNIEHESDRAIVITRNPLDVLTSMFLFINTGSHSMTCAEQYEVEFAEDFDNWVRGLTNNFKLWHKYLIKEVATKMPVYFFRYEDVTNDGNRVMSEIFRFALNEPNI